MIAVVCGWQITSMCVVAGLSVGIPWLVRCGSQDKKYRERNGR